jgi:HSP20 family protein
MARERQDPKKKRRERGTRRAGGESEAREPARSGRDVPGERQPAPANPAGFLSFLSRFRTEFDRFFAGLSGELFGAQPAAERTEALSFPAVEILSRKGEIVVRADLPGLKQEDLKVEVTEGVLTIEGERRHEREEDRGNIYRSERSYGSFFRSVPLPAEAEVESATATFKDGVLEVVMKTTRRPPARPRRIDLQPRS